MSLVSVTFARKWRVAVRYCTAEQPRQKSTLWEPTEHLLCFGNSWIQFASYLIFHSPDIVRDDQFLDNYRQAMEAWCAGAVTSTGRLDRMDLACRVLDVCHAEGQTPSLCCKDLSAGLRPLGETPDIDSQVSSLSRRLCQCPLAQVKTF